MSDPLVLPVTPGVLASGFCPATLQDMLNGFSAVQTVTFPGSFTGVWVSPTAPSDTTLAWQKLDSLGRPVGLYAFASGAWLSRHPMVPGSIMLWDGALPNFTTFDGGDGSALSVQSGPTWEECTNLRAKFPLGVGTLPVSGTVVNVTNTGGTEKEDITLTVPNLPPHLHTCKGSTGDAPGSGSNFFAVDRSATDPPPSPVDIDTENTGGTSGAAVPIPVTHMPPYMGVYFLRRTTRLFYTG
jgi:hypothetical protein